MSIESIFADKLITIAENEQKVFDAGKQAGESIGKQAEWDKFWDAYQNYGERRDYNYAFYSGWNDDCYNPKYPINLHTNINYTTYVYSYSAITDTKVEIISPKGTHMTFYNARNLRIIRKFTVTEESSIANNTFNGCGALEELTLSGTLASAINLSYCPKLNKASIESVFSCMSDTTTGLTATFSTTAKNNAFTTEEWDALVASKPNWTIALA